MDTKRVVILDADSIVWTTAYLNREDDTNMITNLDIFLTTMFEKLKATHYAGFLGGSSSQTFRKKLFPTYKAKRPPKPEWLEKHESLIRTYLIDVWRFQALDDIEADDAVSILASRLRKEGTGYVIGAIDKDLKQIPGEHYNYNTEASIVVSHEEADYNLFLQCLVGDITDNIGGCPGIGKAKAPAILGPGREEYYSNTIDEFINRLGPREGLAKFAETYLLVRLLEEHPVEINLNAYGSDISTS